MSESSDLDQIVVDPAVCHGRPVIRGTRTPVSVVLDHTAGGDSFGTIEREYDVTEEDIRASIAFACVVSPTVNWLLAAGY